MSDETLSNLLREDRRFPPPAALAEQANVTAAAYDEAAADGEGFWAEQAARLDWAEPWTQVLDWSRAPFARWFTGGRLNVAENCLDRHVRAGLGQQRLRHRFGRRRLRQRDLRQRHRGRRHLGLGE